MKTIWQSKSRLYRFVVAVVNLPLVVVWVPLCFLILLLEGVAEGIRCGFENGAEYFEDWPWRGLAHALVFLDEPEAA